MISFLFLIGSILLLISIIIVSKVMVKYSNIPILKFIFINQLGFFFLVFTFFIIIIGNTMFDELQIQVIHKFALISGHIGLFSWFIAFELLNLEKLSVKKYLSIRIIIIFILVSLVYNFLTIVYVDTNGFWRVIYTQFGVLLLLISYGSVFFSQYFLFSSVTVKNYFKNHETPLVRISPTMYLFVCIFIIISFVGGSILPTIIHPLLWTFFYSIAQFIFSVIVLKIPKFILTSEEPIHFCIISDQGTTLYDQKLSTGNKDIEINKQLLGSYLTALQQFGSHITKENKNVDKIKFEDFYLVLKNVETYFRLCYIYEGSSKFIEHKIDDLYNEMIINESLMEHLKLCLTESKYFYDKKEENSLKLLITKNLTFVK